MATPTYLPRVVDDQLTHALKTAGAVALHGPRACGKTETARQYARSEIRLDSSTAQAALARSEPHSALLGEPPRLIDEWQVVPDMWNTVRHAVDDRRAKGQFILTGSSTPDDQDLRHSGAGRIRGITMRTMCLFERQVAPGALSVKALLAGEAEPHPSIDVSVSDYARWAISGGWPGWQDLDADDAADMALSYIEEIVEHDYPLVGGPRRDPRRFRAFLTGYAGCQATPATLAALARRIGEVSADTPTHALVSQLHDLATRLFLVEDQPAWSASLLSRTALIQTPKRHLADPSLACALLGAGTGQLLQQLSVFGHIFESMAVHQLRVLGQSNRISGVFHLRDQKGRDEIDIIVQARDGAWIGIEVKLSHQQIDQAASNLLKVSSKVARPPQALLVVIPSGPVIQRSDTVWVAPLAGLTP